MKNNLTIIITTIFLLSFAAGCKKSEPGITIESTLETIGWATDQKDLEKFYSSDTLRKVGTLREINDGNDILESYDKKIFDKKAKWEIIKHISGDTATAEVTISDHPVQNLIGLKIVISMKLEDGRWKIDRSSEFDTIIQSREKTK